MVTVVVLVIAAVEMNSKVNSKMGGCVHVGHFQNDSRHCGDGNVETVSLWTMLNIFFKLPPCYL